MAQLMKQMDEGDRNFALQMMWLGMPVAMLLLAAQFFSLPGIIGWVSGAVSAGFLIGPAFVGRHDEFVQRMIGRSAAFTCAGAGVWMFLLSVEPFGSRLAIEPLVGLAALALVFHASFAIQRLRPIRG